MGTPDRERRRVFLINPRFQLTFLGYMVAMALVTIGIFYVSNRYFIHEFKAMGESLGLPPEHVYFQFINQQALRMNLIFVVTSVVACAALVFGGLLLSHRVAGPIYRLCRHMESVAEGNSPREVSFRDRDFFPELAETYNQQLRRTSDSPAGAGGGSAGGAGGHRGNGRQAA